MTEINESGDITKVRENKLREWSAEPDIHYITMNQLHLVTDLMWNCCDEKLKNYIRRVFRKFDSKTYYNDIETQTVRAMFWIVDMYLIFKDKYKKSDAIFHLICQIQEQVKHLEMMSEYILLCDELIEVQLRLNRMYVAAKKEERKSG